MKANKKFVNEEEAVSAVIGVILMVAITVAIAATVYVYVGSMATQPGAKAPTIQFSVDEDLDRLVVTTTDSNVKWTDLSIRMTAAGRALVNGDVAAATGDACAANTLTAITAPATDVAASDFIDIECTAATDDVTIYIVHDDTDTTVQEITINSVQIVA